MLVKSEFRADCFQLLTLRSNNLNLSHFSKIKGHCVPPSGVT